jgi:hypothetical protein
MEPTLTKPLMTSGDSVALLANDPKDEATALLMEDNAKARKVLLTVRGRVACYVGMTLLLLMLLRCGTMGGYCRTSGTSASWSKLSCLGDESCMNNTGIVGAGACNGDKACQFNTGNILDPAMVSKRVATIMEM